MKRRSFLQLLGIAPVATYAASKVQSVEPETVSEAVEHSLYSGDPRILCTMTTVPVLSTFTIAKEPMKKGKRGKGKKKC